MGAYILSIDQGTTSSRAIILDKKHRIVGSGQKEFRQIYPEPGMVEHDPADIWRSVEESIGDAIESSGIDSGEIEAIGITNQRETLVAWDEATGEHLFNAIVWQCRRTGKICDELVSSGIEEKLTRSTGLLIDPYFSGTKIRWLLENVEKVKKASQKGSLKVGTIDSFLVNRMTSGNVHVTDASNASRTMLMNLESMQWDEEMMNILGVEGDILPEIRDSSCIYGKTSGMKSLPDGIPISGMAGDQHAALFGQACFDKGSVKCTYGTGAFLLMNTGETPVRSRNRLLGTVGWKIGNEKVYALEGSVFIAGAVVQWLRDGLGIIKSSSDVEALAASVDNAGGVVVVPSFTGLGAPHWNSEARGMIRGLTRGSSAAHIARAAVDSIAYQCNDIMKAMEDDSGLRLEDVKVDGGAVVNNSLMQFQADITGCRITRPRLIETTALGAGFLAGLAVGFWSGKNDIVSSWEPDRVFEPKMKSDERNSLLSSWKDAVERV